ncbi:MAG: CRISPR-associated endonuclease Cas1 [Bryobacteraceae bacterium]|jgi:CRISPR-associated protein Cas1
MADVECQGDDGEKAPDQRLTSGAASAFGAREPSSPSVWTCEQLEEAWLRVEENEGCAGADGVTVQRFAHVSDTELARLLADLISGAYKPLPLLEMHIEKKPGAPEYRRLLIPAVRDRIAQTAVTRLLTAPMEQEFLESSFAYRPHRGVDSAIARVVQLRNRGFRFALRADIQSYFDRVGHAKLMEMIAADPAARPYAPFIGPWLRAPAWDGSRLTQRTEGIPQGSPISPLLSNYFLLSFDQTVGEGPAHLIRYGDDMLLLCASAADLDRAESTAAAALQALGLNLSPTKTLRTDFDQGFDFLGAFFLGGRVLLPWKNEHKRAKMLFLARPMPAALIARYLKRHAGRPPGRRSPIRHHHPTPIEITAMAFLYLTEQGSIVRKSGDRVLVENDGRVLLDLPCHKLESILLFGNVQLTSAAMAELLDHGITMSLFSRHGRFQGSLAPPAGKNIPLRIAQFDAYRDPGSSFELARTIVAAKVRNGLTVLSDLARRHTGSDVAAAVSELSEALRSTTDSGYVQQLDGVEGSAARAYFTSLMSFNRSLFPWPGRLKHPAPDPINALLSLTYTLLMHELMGLTEACGLDPYLGFLHQLDYGRPSLALDLVEAFRHPIADRLVLSVLNQTIFGEPDFHKAPDGQGMVLQADALKRYFVEYEKWMTRAPAARPAYRQSLRAEVESLAKHFRDHTPWTPFDASHVAGEDDVCAT